MTRLEILKQEQELYLSRSKKELQEIKQEIAKAKRTLPKSSFTTQHIGYLEMGTRDLSKEIEKEERNINAVEYNRRILFDYMEKTGEPLDEAREHVRHLFKKVL